MARSKGRARHKLWREYIYANRCDKLNAVANFWSQKEFTWPNLEDVLARRVRTPRRRVYRTPQVCSLTWVKRMTALNVVVLDSKSREWPYRLDDDSWMRDVHHWTGST